jgi:hypothetical protein
LDEFRRRFAQRERDHRDPFDVLEASKPTLDGDDQLTTWDRGQAERVAEENLVHGRFRLFVVVDEISERLARIVDYVNARGRGELKLVAVALVRYGEDGKGVVVPRIRGIEAQSPTARSETEVNPSIDEVLAMTVPEMRRVAVALHTFLAGEGQPGRLIARANRQSISYDGSVDGATRNILQLFPIGGRGQSIALYLDPRALTALGTSSAPYSNGRRHWGSSDLENGQSAFAPRTSRVWESSSHCSMPRFSPRWTSRRRRVRNRLRTSGRVTGRVTQPVTHGNHGKPRVSMERNHA